MAEYRFTGIASNGQPVQGTVFAPNERTAKKKVDELATKHKFAAKQVEKRVTFLFKVTHPSGKVVQGEQKAFQAAEVERALTRMGMEVVYVKKKLFDVTRKPPSSDVIMFVRLAANLL
ncbi:MAG: type II secretion system F family protein, partial [Bacteroidota bacterium]